MKSKQNFVARRLQYLSLVERSANIPISDWILPLRRQADLLVQDGQLEEASRILAKIRRALCYEFDKKGGENEQIRGPERASSLRA